MFHFIYFLKAFATAFITNAHYADIWPIKALAHGGHLGNCLFFLVSGFCLYHIKERFPRWYLKRAIRIYPALWIVIVVDLLVGRISVSSLTAVYHCFIFPTWYHFITSIMILYIAFYAVRLLQNRYGIGTKWFVAGFAVAAAVWYLGFFHKTEYHIDGGVEARAQFFMSMLLGVFLREQYERITPKIRKYQLAMLALSFGAYLLLKVTVPRRSELFCLQGLVPVALVTLVFTLALLAIKLEKRGFFQKLPAAIRRSAAFLSGITLEIYICQELILHLFKHLPFPIDFALVTTLILVYAWIVHKCASWFGRKAIGLLKL